MRGILTLVRPQVYIRLDSPRVLFHQNYQLIDMAKTASYRDYISQVYNNVIKPVNDQRLYSGLTLSNGLKVLLISDPSTEKSAAAMDVNIGSMSDPRSLPGLAHFLEHMLFLGTEKFPDDSEYNKYIAQNGGYCNAYTSGSHTNYHFEVSPAHLSGALERFVEFFLTPLFTESCTERELNIVHSEHDKNLKDDIWRQSAVEKATSNQEHDYSRFSTGNKETLKTVPESLGIDVRQALLDMHSKWYSANIMSLAVLGKESLEELSEMVVTRFKNIENKNVSVPEWANNPLGDEQLRKIINIVPVKDTRSMRVTFPTPDLRKYYKSQPGHYVSHIIGHEGKGSLLSYLKKEDLCTALVSSTRWQSGFGFFNVKVDLTEKGLSMPETVLKAMFEYLYLLKNQLPQEWIFEELKRLHAIQFRFMEKESPINVVRHSSTTLQDFPIEEVFSANILLDEYRPDLIADLLSLLNPENFRVVLVAKEFEKDADQTEKWYGTKYKVTPMDDELLSQLKNVKMNDNFHLPLPNEFIPTNLELVKREDESLFPTLLRNNETSMLWFHQDSQFLVPKAFFGISFTSPYISVDPIYASAASLFTNVLRDSLNEYTYDATLAGASYFLANFSSGLSLWVFGFNENLKLLISKIIQKICAFDFERSRFETMKEIHFRQLRNFHLSQLRVLLTYHTSRLILHKHWSTEQMLETEDQLTFDKLKELMTIIFSKLHIEMFADGNLTSEEAVSVHREVEDKFRERFSSKQIYNLHVLRNRELQLPNDSHYVYEVSNDVQPDNAIQIYLQTGVEEVGEKVKLELLEHILSAQCFYNLRTVEQLGYIVQCGVRAHAGSQGMKIVVQSQRHPEYLETRIENFIAWGKDYIINLSDEEFKLYKDGILIRKADKPKQLIFNALELFQEILKKEYMFDRRNIEIAALEKLTKEDVLDFFNRHIDANSKTRKKFVVRIVSKNSENENVINGESVKHDFKTREIKINDINQFKNCLGLNPLPKPYIDLSVSNKPNL